MTNKQILKRLQKMKNLDAKNQKILESVLQGIQENIAKEDFAKYSKRIQGVVLPMIKRRTYGTDKSRIGAFNGQNGKQFIVDNYRIICLDKPVMLPQIQYNEMVEQFYYELEKLCYNTLDIPTLAELEKEYNFAVTKVDNQNVFYDLNINDFGINVLYAIEIMKTLGNIKKIRYGQDSKGLLYVYFNGELGNAFLAPVRLLDKDSDHCIIINKPESYVFDI